MQSECLNMWVIYDHPNDYPEHFVARRFEVRREVIDPTTDIRKGATLEQVRQRIPNGLFRIARHPTDDRFIVESWF